MTVAGRPPLAVALADERERRRSAAAPGLPFASPAELRAAAPPAPDWAWEGYAARGALTILAGKPKVGKSTLAWAVTGAVASGADAFLGAAVARGPAVYLSEESAATLVPKLPGAGDVRVLTRDAAWPRPPWREVVAGAAAEARRVGAALLVVDTFGFWAQLAVDREKDAGAVQQAVDPLLGAARGGLAVLLVHHHRKAGGEDGDAIRGSSMLAGAADALVEVERPRDRTPNQRRIAAVARWPRTTPELLVDRDPATGAWRVVDEAWRPAERRDEAAERALEALRGAGGGPLAGAAVARELGRPKTDGTVRRALERLERDGLAVRDGRGWALPPAGVATLPGLSGAETHRGAEFAALPLPTATSGNAATGQRCQGGLSPEGRAADGNPRGDAEGGA